MAMYFIGVKRSQGSMANEKTGEMITWDNAVVARVQDVDPEKNPGSVGYEVMTSCKIRMADFEKVTGESYNSFLTKAKERILKPIFVAFGEMKGAKDDRKADTVLLRFLSDDGNIQF